jgi:hypothetical protein
METGKIRDIPEYIAAYMPSNRRWKKATADLKNAK